LAIAPVIALARSEATKAAQSATSASVGRRPSKRAGTSAFGQHRLDGGPGTLGGPAEDLAAVRCGQRLGNRIRPEADHADARWPELTRQDAGEGFDGCAGDAVAEKPRSGHA
jgi:hypothetical protein